ncbi:MAG: GerMN domain-containing protein [Nocardioides sp.]|uniref:GerMN domain-containing protein n=1 Tax=Nocardioides sp. TaxID=35761 RepID=UPI003F04DA7B
MRVRRRAGVLGSVVTVVAVLAGCAGMPVSGPVVQRPEEASPTETPGVYFNPRPAQPGQTENEVIQGFLEAMRASPTKTTVARTFLTESAQKRWAPEEEILTYAEADDPVGSGLATVTLTDVNSYDDRGSWVSSESTHDLSLRLTQEDGEWRIDEAPNALVVPDSWFNEWYRRVSLYRFDPSGEILVPEPAHVPEGDQIASALVRGLLPGEDEETAASRTYFPRGMKLLSVPIDSAGVADVSLTGASGQVDDETAQRMLVQVIWTLRAEPRIRAVRLTVDGEEIGANGGTTQVNLDVGGAYDPLGADASPDLFALVEGRVVHGPMSALAPTTGPMGRRDLGVRTVSANVDGSRVAAVSGGGASLLVAPVAEGDDARAEEVLSGATDLGMPAWDHRDRIWLLDRRPSGAVVWMVRDGHVREVDVPGVSGERATQLLVSRDGTRLAAVVDRRQGSVVLVSRLLHSAEGRLLGATEPTTLNLGAEPGQQVRDLVWHTPTTLAVLSLVSEGLYEIRAVSADGSPAPVDPTGATRLTGRVSALLSSPVAGAQLYVQVGRTLRDVLAPGVVRAELPRRTTSLRYAG